MNENRGEEAAAWRLFRFNWFLIACSVVAFCLGLALTNFRVRPTSYCIVFAIAAVYGSLGYYNAISPERRNPRLAFTLIAIAQAVLVISVMISMTYIATAANRTLMDTTLLGFDRALALDFRSYLNFINDRLWLVYMLAAGYRAIECPIWIITIALPLAGYYRRVAEFICAFMLTLIVSTCISTLVPATGVYDTMQLVQADFPNIVPQSYYEGMREIPALRDGSLRTLDLFQLGGVLTFPSFHAIAAILYCWALWPTVWLRPLNLFCNCAMLVATPVGGGHYFIDVIAGVVIALLSIYTVRRIGRTFTDPAGLFFIPDESVGLETAAAVNRGGAVNSQTQHPRGFCS